MNENWIKQKIEYLSSKIRQLEKGGGGGGGSTPDPFKMDKINPVGFGNFNFGRKKGTTVGLNSYTEGGVYLNLSTTYTVTYVSETEKTVTFSINKVDANYCAEGGYALILNDFRIIIGVDTTNLLMTIYNPNKVDFSGVIKANANIYRYGNTASGDCSHAEGAITTASGRYSHSEGDFSVSSGFASHAEGEGCTASGSYSHAQNFYTIASGYYQTAIGKYNKEDTTKAFIIGNGTSTSARSNAMTVDWEGNVLAKSFNGLEISSGEIPTGNGVTLNLVEGGTYVYFTNCWDSSGAVQANGFTVVTVPKGTKFSSTTPKTYPTGTFTGTTTSLANSGVIKIVRQYSDYTARYVLVRVA